jgi:two-component sensor histidine kinase
MGRRGRRVMERPVVASGRVTQVPSGTSRSKAAASRADGRGTPRKSRTRAPVEADGSATTAGMPDPVILVRELNHRVKNNLQIIVSLMNLQKRILPPERREDLRFIEEHVQSMSVAYRLVYATGSMIEVSLTELVTEVLSGLRQIAGLEEERLRVDAPATDAMIGLDLAIALALYLAVLLPPYLDQAILRTGVVTITLTIAANLLTLSVGGAWNIPVSFDLLRSRLMQAYAAQLKAEMLPAATYGAEQLRFMLDRSPETPATV